METGIKKIIHPAGELIDFETVFEENTRLTEKTEKRGRFERAEYTTDAYDGGGFTGNPDPTTTSAQHATIAVSDFPHNDLYCPYYFYNSLQVLFR